MSAHVFSPAVGHLLSLHKLIPKALQIPSTGPKGRLLKGDILSFLQSLRSAPSSAPRQQFLERPKVNYVDIPVTNMRRVIAQRLTDSKRTIPHIYCRADISMDQLIQVRQKLNESLNGSIKLSLNDFIIRASSIALLKVPQVNVKWQNESIQQCNSVDISIAVSTPTGLITPILSRASDFGLIHISSTLKQLAEKAKRGALKPEEYQGGSFAISNLGMFGVKEFCAIMNPPQAAILAIGSTRRKLSENAKVTQVMNVTLCADARVVDESVTEKFLARFKKLMEDPLMML